MFHVGNMHTKHQRTVSFVLRQWVVTVFDRTTITEKRDPIKGPHLSDLNSQKEMAERCKGVLAKADLRFTQES